MIQLMMVLFIGYLVIVIFPEVKIWLHKVLQRVMPDRNSGIFDNYYVDVKSFYIREFGKVPCVKYISDIDADKVFAYVNEHKAGNVKAIYQRSFYNWKEERQEFGKTIFKLSGNILIHLGRNYVEIYFDKVSYEFADKLIEALKEYKAPEKEEEFEINIISYNGGGLELKQLEIKPTVLDLDLYYNDDFKAVDATIKERLAKENDKGIILLHGLPGTGKTTYLRYLIGATKKKVMFVSPGVAGNLTNPEFIDLLLDNPNCVLVIEDAENIIMDRKYNPNSSVSNLLNISDGLLSDCLNVQLICTFNSEISYVDSALLRKGRLIAKYEFGKLEITKAQKLSDHLGFNVTIKKPMTLAEIANPDETYYEPPVVNVNFDKLSLTDANSLLLKRGAFVTWPLIHLLNLRYFKPVINPLFIA